MSVAPGSSVNLVAQYGFVADAFAAPAFSELIFVADWMQLK